MLFSRAKKRKRIENAMLFPENRNKRDLRRLVNINYGLEELLPTRIEGVAFIMKVIFEKFHSV